MIGVKTLYDHAILSIVNHIEIYDEVGNIWQNSFKSLTPSMRFDIVWDLYQSKKNGSIKFLEQVLQNIDTVFEFLQMGHQRMKLHLIFEDIQQQVSTDETFGQRIALAFARHAQRSNATIALHSGKSPTWDWYAIILLIFQIQEVTTWPIFWLIVDGTWLQKPY